MVGKYNGAQSQLKKKIRSASFRHVDATRLIFVD